MSKGKKYRKRPLEAHNIERMKYISALLREHRMWLGLSQEEVESIYRIPRSVLHRVESQEHLNQNLRTILEVADVYQISPELLFQGVE